MGLRAGRKTLTLRTLPGRDPHESPAGLLARADGFSLHAGVTVGARDSARRERLCRYLARPPVAHDRLSLTRDGRVAYALKTPYRAGTTHVILEPKDFIARLAALVPGPRSHLTRCEYCGGPVRIIASLTDPGVLDRILTARDGAELHGPGGAWGLLQES